MLMSTIKYYPFLWGLKIFVGKLWEDCLYKSK
jgi:hypothetical protein